MSDKLPTPQIALDEFDPAKVDTSQYAGHFSDESFMSKVRDSLGKIGKEALFKALQLYYVLKRPDVPLQTKALILGALGYFICPLDLVPDLLPLIGFADDVSLIAAALNGVNKYVDDEVNAQAQATLDNLLSKATLSNRSAPQGPDQQTGDQATARKGLFSLPFSLPRIFPGPGPASVLNLVARKLCDAHLDGIITLQELRIEDRKPVLAFTLAGFPDKVLTAEIRTFVIAEDGSSIRMENFASNMPCVENALNRFAAGTIAIPDAKTAMALRAIRYIFDLKA